MARVKVYKGKNKTTYQITIYKGYHNDDKDKKKQIKETVTYTLDEMGISAVSDKGNPRAEKSILADVQLFADNLEMDNKGITLMKGKKTKFEDFYREKWIPWAKAHYESSTFAPYTVHIESKFIKEFGSLYLTGITTEKLEELYAKWASSGRVDGREGGYSKVSIVTYNKILASVMGLAVRYKYIEENPCSSVNMPEIAKNMKLKHYTQEQANTFLEMLENPRPTTVIAFYRNWGHSKTTVYSFTARKISAMQYNTYKTLFILALFSGCRIGEMLALTWKDIDFDNCTISINKAMAYSKYNGWYVKKPKTENSDREVVVSPYVIDLLKKLRSEQKQNMLRIGSEWKGNRNMDEYDENIVFSTYDGNYVNKSSANRVLRRLIRNYNATVDKADRLPEISVHCLRHTHATLLIGGDMDVKTVQTRLGHKTIGTTLNIYAHQLRERDEKASKLMEEILNQNTKAL